MLSEASPSAYNICPMSKTKINVYSTSGVLIGYFIDPQLSAFGQGEYEISGNFFDANGQVAAKVDFNPQAVPYIADLSGLEKTEHKRLRSVYVQRGRQPVRMTGSGESSPAAS